MWIVMTSSAHMPSSCWGRYRNVALVQLTQEYTARRLLPTHQPRMISERARGVLRVVHLGKYSVGKTFRCAYHAARAVAEARASALNAADPIDHERILLLPDEAFRGRAGAAQ